MPTRLRSLGFTSIPVAISCLVIALVLISPTKGFGSNKATQRNTPAPPDRGSEAYGQWLTREVGHELNLLPWLTIFDNLQYQVHGSEVTLMGQVVNPVDKDNAENAVKNIEGVTHVVDNIEVLPVGPMDWQIRRAEYRAIYSAPQLEHYGMGTMPSIHIIVNSGHVTLVGFVDNEGDRNVANLRANSVPNIFSVTNNLQIRGGGPPEPNLDGQ